jgi:hypothetical protein
MTHVYVSPVVEDFGSLEEMTAQLFNKVGPSPDVLTGITGGAVVGSFTILP